MPKVVELSDLEESQARDRVRGILQNLRRNYKDLFGQELNLPALKNLIEHQIEELRFNLIKETLSHLFEKHSCNPIDLFRASIIIDREIEGELVVQPKASGNVTKRGRPRVTKQ